jgi:16S rRNA (cytidine1402-2'-O)-methyltransferase
MSRAAHGTLYVVSTPIGNLEDVTLRALRVLREVDLVAAEDTRRTARLLSHYDIRVKTTSLHEHNERARSESLLSRLQAGESIALVSDAGTPLLSDPGAHLVRAAKAAGVRVEPVPGPSAILAALAAAGLAQSAFMFLGFPPRKSAERRSWLIKGAETGAPLVIFEAPHRLRATLGGALSTLGDRPVVICRELTKIHEEIIDTTLRHAVERYESTAPIGEFTLVLAGGPSAPEDLRVLSDEEIWSEFRLLTENGARRRDAVAQLARRLGRPAREVYAAAERGKMRASHP